jgi:hypothetical protein
MSATLAMGADSYKKLKNHRALVIQIHDAITGSKAWQASEVKLV